MSDLVKKMGCFGDSRHPCSSHEADLLAAGYPVALIDKKMLLKMSISGFIGSFVVDDDIKPVLIRGVSLYFRHHSIRGGYYRSSFYIVDFDSVMKFIPAGIFIHGDPELF